MHAFRHLLAQRRFAVLLCAATLLLKLLVPGGYMIGSDHGRITITVCSGVQPRTVVMEMPGMHGAMPDHDMPDHDMPDHEKGKDHGKSEMPCAFSGLSAAALNAIDPIQFAALIVFIMAMGIVGVALPAPSASPYLRPPLRGPPAYL